MAVFPPGYPPPSPGGSPFGGGWPPNPHLQRESARQARSVARAQIKAQRDAFRAQRLAYKQQTRALRRSSILGPLLVVAIGIVLLLLRTGSMDFSEFAYVYSRWWPFLFIVAGGILALEWAFDQYSHQQGGASARRSVGSGVIVLLILLALTGASIQHLHEPHTLILDGLHLDSDNVGEFLGERHEYEQVIDQPFTKGTTMTIDNPHGDVTVVGKSDDNKVHIVVNKQIYALNGSVSDRRADQLSPRVSLSNGNLSIAVPALEAASADLAITVPDFGETTINAARGAINISDLHAPVTLTAGHGDTEIDRIRGTVTAHLGSSSASFSAHSIQGDVQLKGHADDLNLTNISGRVSLEGDFYGDTHLEAIGGPVSFRTSRTQFTFSRLDGMSDISSDEELTGSQIIGPTELHTRSRNISLERLTGSVDIVNANGTVDVTSAAPLGNISIDNADGEVSVTVPPQTGITVEAATREGAIEDELLHKSLPSGPRVSDTGSSGDGALHLGVHTTHADINLHEGMVEPPSAPAVLESPATPARPQPPASPKRRTPAPPAESEPAERSEPTSTT